jgi:aminoglycoside phosphotransferase (APT) family kinase protein
MRDAVATDLRAAGADLSRLATPPAWLQQVADPDLVAAALRRHVPGIRACEVVRVRIKAQAFTAVYRVAVAGAAGRPDRIVELRGDLSPPGRRPPPSRAEGAFDNPDWSCSLPELHLVLTPGAADAALPALPALTDPRLARELVERAIGQAAAVYAGFRVVSCRLDVARHKPGSRCTVVYDLELPAEAPPGWPRAVVAKTYWGGKGRVAWDGMVALWRSPLGATSTVAIAEPLAFLDEERVLLQRAIPHETTFKEALRTTLADAAADAVPRLRPILERAALGLAELHRSGALATSPRSWEDELREVREVADRLASLVPSTGGTAAGLLSQLERHAAGQSSPRAVPSHGSFRPAQVVVDADGRIGFIDFDSFCTSEPAHDVALFCSSLRDTGLRALLERSDDSVGHLAVLDDLCDVFVAAYRSVAPVSPVRVALWETLDALTAVQHCWTKVKFDRLAYRMALLEHRLVRGVDG